MPFMGLIKNIHPYEETRGPIHKICAKGSAPLPPTAVAKAASASAHSPPPPLPWLQPEGHPV